MDSIPDLFKEYLELSKELTNTREIQKEIKKKMDSIEKSIKEYMTSNEMDSITLKDGEIVLYNKKIPQTFKKETIVEKLTEELKDQNKAEELTKSIIQNKKFIVENKLKAVIKKKK